MMSTAMAAAGMTGALTVPGLAQAAKSTYERRFASEPEVTLKYGAAGYTPAILNTEKAGMLHFVREIEARTDGAVRIEYLDGGQICNQLDCVKKTQQGIIDVFSASTQNSAASAPYYNVIDFPYLFPSRASMHHFFYHPKSEELFRKPLRERHGIEFLYTHCELRGLYLGLKWDDKPLVTSIDEIAGAKIRATGSQMGRKALGLMGLNPVPVAWEETLEGLKSGLIDGAETGAGAVAYAGMSPVVSQALEIGFFANTEHAAFNRASFEKLSPKHQDAVLEAAYSAQIYTQGMNEAALIQITGRTPTPYPGSIWEKEGVRVSFFSDEEIDRIKGRCTPEANPEPWAEWRERLNGWSGGHDTYAEIGAIAREIPEDTLTVNVEPRRWWRS
ncbi:MAG: TRAP transporter substrate-binding protein DctP [Proteobacteria bacterium]|nr:MAG: TRAP transporter substrate-binding protein DctP [Pseudomonadota bacterium]